jgi:signal peptidase II
MARYNFIFYSSSILIFILDQVAKIIVKSTFSLGESRRIVPSFNLTYVENRGIAFGFLHQGGDLKYYFLIVVTFIAVAILFYMFYAMKNATVLKTITLALIMGGALGNLYDRLFRGAVIDFLDVYAGRFHWPVFNIADSSITIGILLILYWQLVRKEEFF